MYHSVTLGDKNTWDDWGLVSKERPFVAPPKPKTNFIDVPGSSIKLDFSEGLTGYPTYENRTGAIEFTISDQHLSMQDRRWASKYAEIQNYINGRKLKMILEDDPDYFYEGRFSIDSYKPGTSASESFATISIAYDVGPYKWSNEDSIQGSWLWDPFSFVDGVIVSSYVKNIPVTTTQKSKVLPKEIIGTAPFVPEFMVYTNTTGASMTIRVVNEKLKIDATHTVQNGNHMFYDSTFWADALTDSKTIIYYRVNTGTGTLSLKYRKGGL